MSRIERLWENLNLGYSFTSKAYRIYNKRTMKVIETVNVVIDESSNSGFEKVNKEFLKEILPPEPKEVQEIVEQKPVSPSIPVLEICLFVVES